MNTKIVVLVLAVILLAAVTLAEAQQPKKAPRIGFLGQSKHSSLRGQAVLAFRQKLRELGWVEGENIIIEWRLAEGVEERVPEFVADFIRLKVDVMVLTGGRPVRVAKKATNAIPIVMTEASDPVGTGLIASLARPGGNITGMTSVRHELDGKRLEILKESVSKLSHVAILWQSSRSRLQVEFERTELAARELGMKLQFLGVQSADDFGNAFQAIPRGQTMALIAVHTQLINSHRDQIVEMAAKRRIPAIYHDRRYADSGGLMSYGPNHPSIYAQSAAYVNKILKGAKPADLPVEQPTKLELVINLKAARRIGLPIPPDVLMWADEVIR
ncbi:MAG: ABC transporter substrate-binding protein [Deltaproteobacteria bacterium]|nr:ABC transporter substrate-binding protein [Deltaproteobacteria bacterium]